MPTISTTTANKQAITRTVTSSLRSHVDELVSSVGGVLYPGGVPDDVNLRSFFLALADSLARDFNALAAADREVAREVGEDQQARAVRDERILAIRESLIQVRSLLTMGFSQVAIAGLGLGGRIPSRAEPLVAFARNVAEKLATVQAPASTPGFVRFDLVAAAQELEARAQSLDDSLTALARDLRETQAVQGEHSAANDTWQRHYGPIARMIEGSFLLADMDHQAARVRPTARRNAGQLEPDDLDGGEAAAAPTEEEAAEPERPAASVAAAGVG